MSVEQIRKRLENQEGILLALHRHGAQQRSALSERLGIRKSSVTSIVADLLGRGVIREVVPGATRSPLELERDGFRVVAAVLESGRMHLAEVGFDGQVRGYESVETDGSAAPRERLGAVAAGLARRVGSAGGDLAGVGIAIPGLVDKLTGTGVYAVNLPGWKDVPVREWLAEETGREVEVIHDGHAQLLGNTWFSPAEETSANVVHLCLTGGVSCGVMVDGRLLTGDHLAVGEIGCLKSGSEGRPCACGKEDCLQTYVSVPALAEALGVAPPAADGGGRATADRIADAAKDAAGLKALDAALAPLADKLSAVMALIDPQLLLVGTESTRLSEVLVPLLQQRLDADLRGLYARPVDVRPAAQVTEAALRGIGATAMQRCFARGEFASAKPAAG